MWNVWPGAWRRTVEPLEPLVLGDALRERLAPDIGDLIHLQIHVPASKGLWIVAQYRGAWVRHWCGRAAPLETKRGSRQQGGGE